MFSKLVSLISHRGTLEIVLNNQRKFPKNSKNQPSKSYQNREVKGLLKQISRYLKISLRNSSPSFCQWMEASENRGVLRPRFLPYRLWGIYRYYKVARSLLFQSYLTNPESSNQKAGGKLEVLLYLPGVTLLLATMQGEFIDALFKKLVHDWYNKLEQLQMLAYEPLSALKLPRFSSIHLWSQ